MTNLKTYFGVPGMIFQIPSPMADMVFESGIDTDRTTLANGGRSVFKSPTTYRNLNMTWKGFSPALRPLIAAISGQMNVPCYYITDPSCDPANVLPPRWSTGWQLAHQANGWCKPVIVNQSSRPLNSSAVYPSFSGTQFTQYNGTLPAPSYIKTSGVLSLRVIRLPGEPYFFAQDAVATGGAGVRVRGYNSSTNVWDVLGTFSPSTTVNLILQASDTTYTMIELDLNMPIGSTLLMYGMVLGTSDPSLTPAIPMPVGSGVGAVQLNNAIRGTLQSKAIDRIGLSVDFMEMHNGEGTVQFV